MTVDLLRISYFVTIVCEHLNLKTCNYVYIPYNGVYFIVHIYF